MCRRRIADGQADGPQKSAMRGSPNGAMAETCRKLRVGEAGVFRQLRSQRVGRRLERGFGGGRGLYVIWADIETVIAAENTVPQFAAEFIRDRIAGTGQFNGEVGNAAAGIDDVRLSDRTRGTGAHAQRTGFTEIDGRLIGIQLHGRENFSQQQPGAEAGRDEIGMFADPAQSGLLRPRFFHDGAGVDVPARVSLRGQLTNARGQLFEPRAHHVMIILSPGIPRDSTMARRFIGLSIRVVILPDGNDGSAAGEYELRISAPLGIASHPCHRAAIALPEPLPQSIQKRKGGGLGQGDLTDADGVEAQRGGFVLNGFGERHG